MELRVCVRQPRALRVPAPLRTLRAVLRPWAPLLSGLPMEQSAPRWKCVLRMDLDRRSAWRRSLAPALSVPPPSPSDRL
jgi:hypothetical protein